MASLAPLFPCAPVPGHLASRRASRFCATFVVLYLKHKTWQTGAQSQPNDAVREVFMLFPTTIAGSLPKPEWLAEPNTLWAPWKTTGSELARAKREARIVAVRLQEESGADLVTHAGQGRQHR